MAKKKPQKTIIIKGPKIANFDLSFTKTSENIKIITALENLKSAPGWVFLAQVFGENIKFLENQIITKIGSDNLPLSDQDVDKLRDKHAYLKELLEKPDFFLKKLRVSETVEENLDPYS